MNKENEGVPGVEYVAIDDECGEKTLRKAACEEGRGREGRVRAEAVRVSSVERERERQRGIHLR